ncbi:MAG: DinB family protein [Terriglobia bacterium]
MISLELLRELYDYNFWARDQQLAACAELNDEQFARPLGSSFGSLRDTLKHLLGAEWVWSQRFHGQSPRSFPGTDELQTLDSIRQRWQSVESQMRGYLQALQPEALGAPLTYVNFKGETWTYRLWQCLVHLVNHGTYHRGQVTMALRQLGITPPGIDFLVYYDQRK